MVLLSHKDSNRNRLALTVIDALWKICRVGLTFKMVGWGFKKCNQRISALIDSRHTSYVYSIDLCSTIRNTIMGHNNKGKYIVKCTSKTLKMFF
jgi:hypothetical protein